MKTLAFALYKTRLLPAILLLFPLLVQAQYEHLLHKKYAEKQAFYAEKFGTNYVLKADSVRYFNEVQKVYDLGVVANDRSIIHESMYLKLDYFASKNHPHYIAEMLLLIRVVDLDQNKALQARTRLALASYYYTQKKDYLNAFKYVSSSSEYLADLSLAELPEKREMLFAIAWMYYQVGSQNKSLYFLNLANSYPKDRHPDLQYNILNTKGLIETNNKNFDVAITSFNQLLELSSQRNDTLWHLIGQANLAAVYVANQNYIMALDIFTVYDRYASDKYKVAQLNIWLIKSKIYQKTGAQADFNSSIQRLMHEIKDTPLNAEKKEEIYPLLAVYYKENQQLDLAYTYADSALYYSVENREITNSSAVRNLDIQDQLNLLKQKDLELQNNDQQFKMLRIGGLGLTLFLTLMLLVIFNYVRKADRRRRVQLEIEKLRIKKELQTANEKLKISLRDLLVSRGNLTVIKSQLQKIDLREGEQLDSKVALALEDAQFDALPLALHSNHWPVLLAAFEKAYPLFVSKIKKKLPHITTVERKYLILKKMGLEAREIAQIMEVSTAALRVYSHRIRKKHHFDSNDSLDEFITAM
ncbi:helix-turn-helix transcriptional regulator [Flavobacterium sp. JP2137]|uniref:helix-turn-helix transcriptional regulator n=1 Tax=Flavobacterium sp. JP2137 TaxID=3414510 RepID=UPI003D2FCC91